MEKYEEHYIIEVSHQYGVETKHCKSFWEAMAEEIDHTTIDTLQQAEDWYDNVPEKLATLLKNGSVIEIDGEFYSEKNFDKEKYALEEWGRDLANILVIDSKEDAEWIIANYKGHESCKVKQAAADIIYKEDLFKN